VSVTECYQHKIVDKSNLNSFSLSLASALHQSANSTTLTASALVLKFSAFFVFICYFETMLLCFEGNAIADFWHSRIL